MEWQVGQDCTSFTDVWAIPEMLWPLFTRVVLYQSMPQHTHNTHNTHKEALLTWKAGPTGNPVRVICEHGTLTSFIQAGPTGNPVRVICEFMSCKSAVAVLRTASTSWYPQKYTVRADMIA
eukprot:3715996-Amphidinium_carterae.1